MSAAKKDKPMKNNNTVNVSNLPVEFLAKKTNDYNAEICYMKIVDKDVKKKLKNITSLESESIRMPYWLSSDKETLLKGKR